MTATPLPKSSKVLEILLQDCTQKLSAVSNALVCDKERLKTIEELSVVVNANARHLQKSGLTIASRMQPTSTFDASPMLSPYLDRSICRQIEEVRQLGISEIEAGIGNSPDRPNWKIVKSGFTHLVAANHALVILLSALQSRVIGALERGRADTEADKQKKIHKIGSIEPVYYELLIELRLHANSGRTEIDITRDFVRDRKLSQKPESLLRGVRRLRQSQDYLCE